MIQIIQYFEKNKHDLVDRFFRAFDFEKGNSLKEQFKKLVNDRIFGDFYSSIFVDVDKQQKDLIGLRKEIDKEIKSKKLGEKDPERLELVARRKYLGSILKSIDKRQIMEHLTNIGALPNYAFPETGTTLNARVVGGNNQAGVENNFLRDLEIIRPASQGLKELAPDNHFYSQGFQLKVEGVNTFDWSDAKMFHTKRFCSNCDYISIDNSEKVCPKCGDMSYGSEANKHSFAKLNSVKSFNYQNDATVGDGKDDREQVFYRMSSHYDFSSSKSHGSYSIDSVPFGIELTTEVNFVQMNLGRTDVVAASNIKINDQEVPRHGFITCKTCGKSSSHINQNKYELHYPYCKDKDKQYKGQEDKIFKEVFFFREFKTELLKVLLPVQEVNTVSEINMFKASIELGLKKYYRGNPQHIRIENYREFNATTNKFDNYLLLIDSIPGGTGYLSELFDWDNFRKVLEEAYNQIKTCECQYSGLKGCYNCIYTYSNQYVREDLDRSIIEIRLKQILDFSIDATHSSTGLNQLDNKGKIEESELETRFITLLRRFCESSSEYSLVETNEYGTVTYELKYNSESLSYTYKIRPQILLAQKDGVQYSTRSDFEFTCTNMLYKGVNKDIQEIPRIVIYLDGYQYHASEENNSFNRDLEIRQSIKNSQGLISWTLTWKDLDLFENSIHTSNDEENNDIDSFDYLAKLLLADEFSITKNKLLKATKKQNYHRLLASNNNVDRLLFLLSNVNTLSNILFYLSCFQKELFKPSYEPEAIQDSLMQDKYKQYCLENKTLDGLLPMDLASNKIHLSIKAATNLVKEKGHVFIDYDGPKDRILKDEWENFWILYNLIQFFEEFNPTDERNDIDIIGLLELYDDRYQPIIEQAVEKGYISSIEDENRMESLTDDRNRVIAEAQLIIHAKKIVIKPNDESSIEVFQKAGYKIIDLADIENIIL